MSNYLTESIKTQVSAIGSFFMANLINICENKHFQSCKQASFH